MTLKRALYMLGIPASATHDKIVFERSGGGSHYGFRARLFTRVRPSFFTELSMPKAFRKLSECCSVT